MKRTSSFAFELPFTPMHSPFYMSMNILSQKGYDLTDETPENFKAIAKLLIQSKNYHHAYTYRQMIGIFKQASIDVPQAYMKFVVTKYDKDVIVPFSIMKQWEELIKDNKLKYIEFKNFFYPMEKRDFENGLKFVLFIFRSRQWPCGWLKKFHTFLLSLPEDCFSMKDEKNKSYLETLESFTDEPSDEGVKMNAL